MELCEEIARFAGDSESVETSIPGLFLYRRPEPTEPESGMYVPSVCVVAQGAKRVFLGNERFVYNARNYLITSLHLPTLVQVIDATPERPYLGLRLDLDLREVAQMMVEHEIPVSRERPRDRGMATGEMTPQLLEAFRRLVGLLGREEEISVLAPLIRKEILYRLLVGDLGGRLRQIANVGSQSHQISRAVEWLKTHYDRSFLVEDLAREIGMSTSTFHHHFRELTALSPLQYQKQLRLREARRLMLMEHRDAASASFQVGYESPSQFSREYNRLFGAPPLKDIRQLRELSSV